MELQIFRIISTGEAVRGLASYLVLGYCKEVVARSSKSKDNKSYRLINATLHGLANNVQRMKSEIKAS